MCGAKFARFRSKDQSRPEVWFLRNSSEVKISPLDKNRARNSAGGRMAVKIIYIVFTLLSFVNGAWMLLSPESWYTDLPAGVPDTGPYNGHFIRDLGFVFVLISAGFLWCAIHPNRCKGVSIVLTVFFTGHAMLHVLDLLTNRLPHSHWRTDIPAVFLPAVLLILLTATQTQKTN